MREVGDVAAGAARAARTHALIRAEQELAEPEAEPLLADTDRAVKQQAGGDGASRRGVAQPDAQGLVADQGNDGHPVIMDARPRGCYLRVGELGY